MESETIMRTIAKVFKQLDIVFVDDTAYKKLVLWQFNYE